MTRQEKDQFIESITEKLEASKNLYLADISGLTVSDTNELRRLCFNKGVEVQVVKNTLLRKAMEKAKGNYEESYELLVGNTALMTSERGSVPAKVIKEFRKKHDKPVLKAAFIEESFYLGDEQVKELASLKSKDELIGEIIDLLQSPAKNVISALQSGGSNLSGILTTLADRPEASETKEEALAEEVKEEPVAEEKADDSTEEKSDEETPAGESGEEAKNEEEADESESADSEEGADDSGEDKKTK
jgi:large subunit ribosomal protein L10